MKEFYTRKCSWNNVTKISDPKETCMPNNPKFTKSKFLVTIKGNTLKCE